MASNFKVFFNNMIWSRGNAYYLAGKVGPIKKVGKKMVAKVQGSSSYFVTFTTDPVSMLCTCPYAKDGHNCKHMAAAFIAYEKTNKNEVKSKNEAESYSECRWYAFIDRSLNKQGTMKNIALFTYQVNEYISMIEREDVINKKVYINELFLLIRYIEETIEKFYYDNRQLYDLCLEQLQKIKKLGNSEKIEKELQAMLMHTSSEDLICSIIEYCFYRDEDYPIIERFFMRAGYTDSLFDTVMECIQEHNVDKVKLEQFSLKFKDFWQARHWLINYYWDSKQYEKGIQLLQTYCYGDAKINQNIHRELYELFRFYTKGNHSSRDALFTKLLSDRKIDKADLFKTYKDGMNDDDWQTRGKELVRDWTKGKSDETCYKIFEAIESADLMFEKLIVDGFSTYTLRKYFAFLSSYDEGLVYSMYKLSLKHKIDTQPSSIQWILSNFYDEFPMTENANKALKMILVEMQNEFEEDDIVRMTLESLEETLYEKEKR